MIKYEDGIIEISNVLAVEQFGEVQYYTTQVSIEELSEIRNRITYDGDAQRGLIDGKPSIDKKHVNSIKDAFINGNSIRGHLTWNLRKENGDQRFEYDQTNESLMVSLEQLITIPDSAHRHEAFRLVAEECDDESILNSKFVVDIYNITKPEEIDLFYTINGKVKAPNKNRTLYLSSEIESKLLRDIIAQSKLDGRIECVQDSTDKVGRLTKFSTLYESLFGTSAGSFDKKLITEDTYHEYLKWLIDFYNELLETREEFSLLTKSDRSEFKKSSMILEELSWWGYGFLARELMSDRKWRHNLHTKLNKKNESGISVFDKSLDIWQSTVIKPKYDFNTNTRIYSTSINNSSVTRKDIKKIFTLIL